MGGGTNLNPFPRNPVFASEQVTVEVLSEVLTEILKLEGLRVGRSKFFEQNRRKNAQFLEGGMQLMLILYRL